MTRPEAGSTFWICADARQFARHAAVSVGDRVGGGDPASSPASCCRRSIVDATERAFDRRLNLYLRTLIAEVGDPGRTRRPPVPVARRAAVRSAAVRLVLADRPQRRRQAGNARVALAVGQEAAEARGAGRRADRGRRPPRLCRRPRRPDPAHGGAAGRSRRRRQVPASAVAGDATEIFDETRTFDYYLGGTFAALDDRAAADHDLSGAVWSCAAEAHFRRRSPTSAPAAPNGWRANSRSRSRRWRARPMR